jgi:large subunit ribosomal protein L15
MATLSTLQPYKGARKKSKRLGTGEGSGHGQTSTRGQKGQRSRAGDGKQFGFAGGQNPLFRRIPKRGFNNHSRKEYQPVNLAEIELVFSGSTATVNAAALRERGLAKGRMPIKVLGDGELKGALTIEAQAFSKSALEKIAKAGGKAVVAA